MAAGIVGYGVYIPKYRIDRKIIGKAWSAGGRGQNSVRYHDEDVITMAAEACTNAIQHGGIDASGELDAIYLGTDSCPHIEHSSLGIIGEVLRAKEELDMADFTASPRAALAAFKACQDAAESRRIGYGLVIGSEARSVSPGSPEEMNCGDGAAALLLGREDTIADIQGVYTYASHIVDRWREMDAPYPKEYEPRFTRDYGYLKHIIKAKDGILERIGARIEDFQHVVLQQPDGRMLQRAVKGIKARPEQSQAGEHVNAVGDLGAASVFTGLAAVLDRAEPGDRILLLSYGSGVSDAVALRVTQGILAKRERSRSVASYVDSMVLLDEYTTFARMKGVLKKESASTRLGIPPASSALWRDGRDIREMNGIKCKKCGYVNYPPSIRKICIRCGDREFDRVVLSRKGKVHTYCISLYVPPPLKSPQPIIIADLDDGNRYRALGTEIRSEEDIYVEMPVELVLRNIIGEDGLGVYGNVFRPLRTL